MPEKNFSPQSTSKSSPSEASGKESFAFYVWSGLLTPQHRKQMGIAVWVYLWCVNRTTWEENGVGFVLGGSRIKIERIALELGVTSRTVSADLRRLQKLGYLQIRRIPYGLVIAVLKSKRGFERKRSEESFPSQIGRNLPISTERSEESFRADRKEPSDIKDKSVRVIKEKRVSSSASPHKSARTPMSNSEKPKTTKLEVAYA